MQLRPCPQARFARITSCNAAGRRRPRRPPSHPLGGRRMCCSSRRLRGLGPGQMRSPAASFGPLQHLIHQQQRFRRINRRLAESSSVRSSRLSAALPSYVLGSAATSRVRLSGSSAVIGFALLRHGAGADLLKWFAPLTNSAGFAAGADQQTCAGWAASPARAFSTLVSSLARVGLCGDGERFNPTAGAARVCCTCAADAAPPAVGIVGSVTALFYLCRGRYRETRRSCDIY